RRCGTRWCDSVSTRHERRASWSSAGSSRTRAPSNWGSRSSRAWPLRGGAWRGWGSEARDARVSDPGPNTVVVRAMAKVNLFLRVVGRREDGYHDLESLIVPVDLADRLEIHAA